ncbi:DUF3889 domain-containing protein [Alteribacter natronophilus]|uniref:DUF3889 domain-containing protein n=1 Tax=Alteribacter natronophilus TaxID=2583810 RepID=UPI0014875956|nr:DUF3889 domain-containing protein [Alteribacter natronophilus]
MKILLAIMIVFVLFQASPLVDPAHGEKGGGQPLPSEQQEEPDYAKWGKLAVEKVRERYPEAKVVDYLHVGREELGEGKASETFKLWLRGEEREFGVIVTITFEKATDDVIEIEYEETDR